MPTLEIVARLPLGVFQGRRGDGATRDPFPDVARLHSALMAAAGKGSLALERNGDLRPSAASLRALEWLDQHPPEAVQLPQMSASRPTRELIAYRWEGVYKQGVEARSRKSLLNRTAVSGAFGWRWDDAPADVIGVVEQLVSDVGCLGEADSPVVLELAPIFSTHLRDPEAPQIGSVSGVAIRCPEPGRTQELERAYEAGYPRRRPSLSRDAYKLNESAGSLPVVTHARDHQFVKPEPPAPTTPWATAMVFPMSRTVPPEERVAWAVAFHRMLAARLGDDAPSSITGLYPESLPRPANRVAVQVLGNASHLGVAHSALLLMLPQGLGDIDRGRLVAALAHGSVLRSRFGVEDLRCVGEVQADEFWYAPAIGTTRFWAPAPALVAETRRQPDLASRRWTLAEAALLSLGFVFRDSIPPAAAGRQRYWSVVDHVIGEGARVVECHPLADSRAERYAHKLPSSLVVQPFTALLYLGSLAGPRDLVAIGQSRHLGGGLLQPVDLPGEIAEGLVA